MTWLVFEDTFRVFAMRGLLLLRSLGPQVGHEMTPKLLPFVTAQSLLTLWETFQAEVPGGQCTTKRGDGLWDRELAGAMCSLFPAFLPLES